MRPIPRVLRLFAAALIQGEDATFVLGELEEAAEREIARGLSVWAVRARFVRNALGSAWSLWRSRWSRGRVPASWLDAKLGLRMLRKYPGLTLAAVFALSVGIPVGLAPGHAARLFESRPPFEDADQLHVVDNLDVGSSNWSRSAAADYLRWRDGSSSFAEMAASVSGLYNVTGHDGGLAAERGARMTASGFDLLRVPPHLGRMLQPADEVSGAPAVVVLGYDIWTRRYGSDPEIVGKSVRIGADLHTVVGVMPEDFLFPIREGFWLPLSLDPATAALDARALRVFGRLGDGTSLASAQTEFDLLGQRAAQELPETHARLVPQVLPFTPGLYGLRGSLKDQGGFYFFQVLAVLILIVACVNVGMLIFTRTSARARELAVRTALGASRRRIVSQLFVEALVLALIATGVGLILADRLAIRSLSWIAGSVPVWFDLGITGRSVFWALALAVLSAVVMGVIPALKATGKRVQENIQRANAEKAGVRFGGFSSALIVVDVALAVATVTLAVGLHDRSERQIATYEAAHYLSASLLVPEDIANGGDPVIAQAFQDHVTDVQAEVVRRLQMEGPVGGAALANLLPGMDHGDRNIEIQDYEAEEGFQPRATPARISLGFFDTFEHPIRAGRGFSPADHEPGASAVIVDTGFSEALLNGQNPLGRRFRYVVRGEELGPWHEIVGVVGPLGMGRVAQAGVYHPMPIGERNPVLLAARVGEDAADFQARLRTVVAEIDPDVVVSDLQPLDTVFSFNRFALDWVALGARIMIGILFALSVSGIYALMSFTVTRRTREIGIRAALGSGKGGLTFTIARRALAQLGIGVTIGGGAALALLWRIEFEGLVQEEIPMLLAFGTALALTALIGVAACTAPTLRALRIRPAEAFRSEG